MSFAGTRLLHISKNQTSAFQLFFACFKVTALYNYIYNWFDRYNLCDIDRQNIGEIFDFHWYKSKCKHEIILIL